MGIVAAIVGSTLLGVGAQASAASRQRKAAREQERRIQEQERLAREQAHIEENRARLQADDAVAYTAQVKLGRSARRTGTSTKTKRKVSPQGAVASRVGGLMAGGDTSRRIGL